MLQMMRPKQTIACSPHRVKSFLTPYSKFGARSLSTTETHTPTSQQPQKTYIDFRRINRQKQNRSNLRIKAQENTKKQNKKDQKLYKCTMNRYKQQNSRQQKYEDSNGGDLVKMVRQLKQRVINLEIENKMLKQKQEEDMKKIQKQNQIIKNLEQAIYLNRGHASFSMMSLPKESRYLCLSDFSKQSKSTNMSFEQVNQLKGLKFQQQNTRHSEKCNLMIEQNKKMKTLTSTIPKAAPNPYLAYQKNRAEGLERALQQIQERKLQELEQIDQILFGSCL